MATKRPLGSKLVRNMIVKELHMPPMEEVVETLQTALKANYKEVEVAIVDCPDLSSPPWDLAAKGICGDNCILDVGGVKNMDYPINHVPLKQWDIEELAKRVGMPGGFFIGAGAASPKIIGDNGELAPNTNIGTKQIKTRSAEVAEDGSCVQRMYPSNDVSAMANLFGSKGCAGKVIKVHVKVRTGKTKSLITCMRQGLIKKYGDNPVALGGVFQLLQGKLKAHVMPCFPQQDLVSQEIVDDWLNWYEVPAPATCLSVQVTQNMGLELRVEHTHFFTSAENNHAGHYHYDTTPDECEYLGYFGIAEKLYRVDKAFLPEGFVPAGKVTI
mmetsp:Transcript_27805/g.30899  ORF Transcript_27805/g.30899 Transcript_27805/m.30899 type:complete len:328 (-) Transcript_27805:24-1007(-)